MELPGKIRRLAGEMHRENPGRSRGEKPWGIYMYLQGRTRGLTGGEHGENPGITANRRNNENFEETAGPRGKA